MIGIRWIFKQYDKLSIPMTMICKYWCQNICILRHKFRERNLWFCWACKLVLLGRSSPGYLMSVITEVYRLAIVGWRCSGMFRARFCRRVKSVPGGRSCQGMCWGGVGWGKRGRQGGRCRGGGGEKECKGEEENDGGRLRNVVGAEIRGIHSIMGGSYPGQYQSVQTPQFTLNHIIGKMRRVKKLFISQNPREYLVCEICLFLQK